MPIELLEMLAAAFAAIIFTLTIFNSLTILRPSSGTGVIAARVEILIPMRNEARNVQGVLSSALNQKRLGDFAVRVLDDGSTDQTGELLSEISNPRFTWRKGGELIDGWLGKNFALHTLSKESRSDYLVFIDADVRLAENAISDSIELMEERGLDYLCPYPRQIAISWLERLMQPLLQWSWFASLPLILAERSLRSSTVVANGQFFLVKSKAYHAIGGHESIKNEVLDDMELARRLRRAGFRGTVVDGTQIATCRMYESGTELISGYRKSQWRAFGGTAGAISVIVLLILTSILPAILAFAGSQIGLISFIAVLLSRVIVAFRVRSSVVSSLFHPIAIAFWIYLIVSSIYQRRNGQLNWRGRAI